MGIDDKTERPAEQAAGDMSEAGENSSAGEQPTGDGEPGNEGHSEEWLANARLAGEKIRAMFKS
jgi:hypothetical protein